MATSEYKIELAKIKAKQKIELKKLGSSKVRYARTLRKIQPAPMLSKEQDMMNDLFGGRGENKVMFNNPNSNCVVSIHGGLMPSNMGDEIDDGETTANSFGMGINRSTGSMFGI